MSKGIRKHIIVTNEQDSLMKKEVDRTGTSESWIIRKAIDEYFERKQKERVK